MLTRYLISIALLILIGVLIKHLLNQQQRKTIHEIVLLSAKVIVLVSLALLFWRLFTA